MSISLNEVKTAFNRIKPRIHKTPVLTNRSLNEISQAKLFFKCENFQKTGAFKFRGALNAVYSLEEWELKNGVATHSSGNHGAALALAGQLRGTPVHVVMPENAKEVKKKAVQGYGANVVYCKPTLDERERTLENVLKTTESFPIHPYNDERIMAGQGTAALEFLQSNSSLDILVAPVGGGGLLSGTAIVAKSLNPKIHVFGAEPEGADDAYQSFQAGKIIPQTNPSTIADGLLTSLGNKTFPIIHKLVDEIITVSEKEIIVAMRLIWERMKIIVEPSSAVALAAILKPPMSIQGKKTGIILSGGNVDLSHLPWWS